MSDSSVIEARALDTLRLAEKLEYDFTYSRFLSPAEQNLFYRTVAGSAETSRLFFFGGCLGADRRRAVFVPSYFELDTDTSPSSVFSPQREAYFASLVAELAPDEQLSISPVHVSGSSFVKLSHKDYMGSVLGLGIDRSVIGDIAVTDDHSAVIFADAKIATFITDSLQKVARDTVKCSISPLPGDFVIPRRFRTVHIACGSNRIDSVAASLAGLSRSEAKELCLSGLVELNYISPVEADDAVSVGDIISIRKNGKFIVDSFDGETRSGRLKLSARQYL